MSLSIYQLRMYARKWLKETYNMDLVIPLELNGRLKTCCGKFVSVRYRNSNKPNTPKHIHLNKFFVENNEPTLVLDVLRHELVHYALFMQGKPFSDGDHYFEKELKRLGIVSQSTLDKYNIVSKPKNLVIYKCVSCDATFKRQRALSNGGKYHRCQCGGNLVNKGRKVVTT